LLFSACVPSQADFQTAIQTAIVQTQAAWTKTPTPTFVPSPTPTPLKCYSGGGVIFIAQNYGAFFNQEVCIAGRITKKDVVKDYGTVYNIFPLNQEAPFLVLVRENLKEIKPNALGILTNADVGDCIFIIGIATLLEGKQVIMGLEIRDPRGPSDENLFCR
jgi:hypothetical protein